MARKSFGASCERFIAELPDWGTPNALNPAFMLYALASYLIGTFIFVVLYYAMYWMLVALEGIRPV